MDPEVTKLLVGVVAPAVTAAGIVAVALVQSRKPAKTEPPSPPPAEMHDVQQQQADNESSRITLQTFELFRQEYDRQLQELRGEVSELKTYVARVTRVLRILREAFRRYIRDVARDWGRTAQPPIIDPHVREMLLEDDLDNTFGQEDMEDVRALRSDLPEDER